VVKKTIHKQQRLKVSSGCDSKVPRVLEKIEERGPRSWTTGSGRRHGRMHMHNVEWFWQPEPNTLHSLYGGCLHAQMMFKLASEEYYS
jgi:hypothetical protein